jgi:Sec-independent protein translocase protein TatA
MLGEIFGPDLIWVVVVIAVVLFASAGIPKLARGLGSANSEFLKGAKDVRKGDGASPNAGGPSA